jgi:two-component system, NtrC family, response regulator HydG
MCSNLKILIIDDDQVMLSTLRILLRDYFSVIKTTNKPENIDYLLELNEWDVILLDMNFSAGKTEGEEGLFWLKNIKAKMPETVIVMMTAYGGIKLAVEATKLGAQDFILKPWENEKLISTLQSAADLSASKRQISELKIHNETLIHNSNPSLEVIGASPKFKELIKKIDKAAPSDANILLLGENGSGKDVIARKIHKQSERKDKPFISVDLGSISESLFESELFGHKKGAFTDAASDYAGRFELANNGTLFLDEIGNLSLAMQSKILTVLQQREITAVGSNKPKSIDVRLICATNKNLKEMTDLGEFRIDLLYRINTIELIVPPLRERRGDIELFVNYFLSKFSKKYGKKNLKIGHDEIKSLKSYYWPGNIRELENTMEKAIIMADGNVVHFGDIGLSATSSIKEHDVPKTMDEIEKYYLERAIKKHESNITEVAKELNISRPSVYRKMTKYGL